MKKIWISLLGGGVILLLLANSESIYTDSPATPSQSEQLLDHTAVEITPTEVNQTTGNGTYDGLSFNGYSCTQDCSGHEAGYEWAAEHGIEDPDDCGGNSNSFIEGCQAYAEERQESEEPADNLGEGSE